MADDLSEDLGRNIPLSEMVQTLRQELKVAMAAGAGEELRLGISQVELELRVLVERGHDAKASVKFWVVDAGAGGEARRQDTHVFRLTLKPRHFNGNDLEVARSEPGLPER